MLAAVFVAVFVAGLAAPAGAQAQPMTPEGSTPASAVSASPTPSASPAADAARDRVDALLRGGHADPAWFAAVFLAQVSPAQVDAIVAQLRAALGAYRSVDGAKGVYTAHFEKGTDEVRIHLDGEAKIDGLFFRPPVIAASSLDDALDRFRHLDGSVTYLLTVGTDGRSERAAHDPATPQAVGSAFKLAVLAAVGDEIAAGRRHWDEVVPLDPAWKSLPSGVMAGWPNGLPVTLATYAAQMISISDNTAADALIRIAGPDALARYAESNQPFLTTRQAFTLKSKGAAALRDAYLAAASPSARAAVLARIDGLPLPAPADIESKPTLGIEWHYSVRDLCRLMGRVADLPLMTINPGIADAARFARVAFKGGSDVGVINFTTQATTVAGATFCFSATLNNSSQSVDEHAFANAVGAVLGLLARD